jgi:thioredoxin-related protein
MRIIIWPLVIGLLCLHALSLSAQTEGDSGAHIEWLSWGEAMARMDESPKKIFVDVYTDWCGWCKRMDATTFKDPAVIKVMNEHFYAVKFDAEQKTDIEYDGHTLKFMPNGRRGVHELAYALLDGKLSYPSFVYLAEDRSRLTISPGYKDASMMAIELQYIGGNYWQDQTFEAFRKSSNGQ